MSGFTTKQKLTCLFCPATTEAVPSTLRGKRYRRRAWYANGYNGVIFALCPEHQRHDHHEYAWAWVKAKANPKPIAQKEIDDLFRS